MAAKDPSIYEYIMIQSADGQRTVNIEPAVVGIQYFEDIGLREDVRLMVGGAPVTQEFADEMGADAYGESAVDAVDKAKELIVLLKDLKS